jgi:TRAP-type C4-dicarboxylate transport system permease small subunit
MIAHIANRLASASALAATVILAAMTLGVLYDVAMRDLFNAPTLWAVEYTGYGMAWIGFLGASEVLRMGEHVGIRVLTDHVGPAMRGFLSRFASLVVALTAGYLAVVGTQWTIDAYRLGEVSDTVLHTPQFVVRIAFPLGMALVALVSLTRLWASPAGDRHSRN